MFLPQAVIVHGFDQASTALRPGLAVTLLSAEGAASAGGCGWWRAVVDQARAAYPQTEAVDILDCADSPGLAMAALRNGQRLLILCPASPAFPAVTAAAATLGAMVLPARPDALDLGERGAERKLEAWLAAKTRPAA